jgi:hypothetical protein
MFISGKYLRLRPVNFPTIRIAQLASFLYNNQALLSNILYVRNIGELQNLLNCATSEYWQHITFSIANPAICQDNGTEFSQ